MKTNIRESINAGIVFGIVTIFLVLIGFTTTAAELISKPLNLGAVAAAVGLTAGMAGMLLFLAILGVLAGLSGGRKPKEAPDTWGSALLRSTLAGFVHGVLLAALVLVVGTLNANGVKLTAYLPQLLPAAINELLYGLEPLPAALFDVGLMTAMGLLGGALARSLGRGTLRGAVSGAWQRFLSALRRLRVVVWVGSHRWSRYTFYGILGALVLALPLVLGQYWNYTLGTIGIYVLLGLGLNIVVGLAGLLDLGYVAFFAIGAYTVALLTAPQPHNLQWNFWVTVPIGIMLAAFAGILLGIPVLRMRGDYLAIVTLGFGQIIAILLKSDLMTPFSGGPKGVSGVGGPTLFGKPFTDVHFVYLILLGVLLVMFVTNRLQNSRIGRAWEAMREDENVARANGIDVMRTKLMAFATGAAFAGLGGLLFAARNQFTGPEDHNLMVSINVLALVIVGGMGSIPGVIAGAFVLKGLPEVLRELEDYRVLAFGALLVVMMIWRPAGLMPSSRRKLDIQAESNPPNEPPGTDAGSKPQ
jgi:ABC-type branched-subunit amino acid transport system permease subunit